MVTLPREYLAAVEELWKLQKPGEAFEGGSFLGRAHTEEILGVEKLLGRAALAAALGRSAKQINKLVDAGMPVARRGARGRAHGYRLEEVEAWLASREDARQPAEFLDAVRERALKERAQRHLAEQTLKVRAGELVAKEEVIAEWSGHAAAVRTKLMGLPNVLDIDDATRAAAGTLSSLDTTVRQETFGFQVLAGADYALTEHASVGVTGRWAQFGHITDEATWDLIRSHAPVQADGVTPFDTTQRFEGISYLAVTVSLKYYF